MRRVCTIAAAVMLFLGGGADVVRADPVERLALTIGHASEASAEARTTPELVAQVSLAEDLYSLIAAWAGLPYPAAPPAAVRLVFLDDANGPVISSFYLRERTVRVGVRAHRDDLAHEIGHAFVHALKPGYHSGVTLVVHEAIADMCAVLAAYLDPRTLTRVLAETGGNLSRENEAAVIGGTGRSASNRLSLQEIEFSPTALQLPECSVIFAGTVFDPHYIAGVLTAALHDLLCALCERDAASGTPLEEMIGPNAAEVGRLMFRALLFAGEHRVTLRDYAAALLRADREATGPGAEPRLAPLLVPLLVRRGFFPSEEAAAAEAAASAASRTSLPRFVLDPTVTDADEVLRRLDDLEALLLAEVRAVPPERGSARYRIPLLFHRHEYPCARLVKERTVTMDTDHVTPDGLRLVRLGYRCPVEAEVLNWIETSCGGDPICTAELKYEQAAWASCLFDASGTLIAIHADRPLPPPMFGP